MLHLRRRGNTAKLDVELAEEQARPRRDLEHVEEVLAEEELDLALAGSRTGSVGRVTGSPKHWRKFDWRPARRIRRPFDRT